MSRIGRFGSEDNIRTGRRSNRITFEIINLTVTPLRDEGYNQQFIKGFTAEADNHKINNILEDIDRNGMATNTTSNSIVRLSKDSIAHADITEGWEAPRCAFTLTMLVTEKDLNRTVVKKCIYNGYTDPIDDPIMISHTSGEPQLNPDMVYVINSSDVYLVKADRNNNNLKYNMHDTLGISPITGTDTREEIVSIRPVDILHQIRNTSMEDYHDTRVYDLADNVSNSQMYSRRSQVGQWYSDRVINGIISGCHRNTLAPSGWQSTMIGDENYEVYALAAGAVKEPSIANDPFISVLHDILGDGLDVPEHYFRMQNLYQIDPTWNEHRRGNGTTPPAVVWNRVNEETGVELLDRPSNHLDNGIYHTPVGTAMIEIGTALVQLCKYSNISNIVININNNEDVYRPYYEVHSLILDNGIVQDNFRLNKIKSGLNIYINNIIHPIASMDNICEYELLAVVDVNTEVNIEMSLEGTKPEAIRMPVFADTKFNPLLGKQTDKEHITETFKHLADEIIYIMKGRED